MKTTFRTILAALILTTVMQACTTFAPEEPKYYTKPSFDQSHAILIDKTVAGLPVSALVKNCVKKTEKIAVMSLEKTYSGDNGVNYLIDDNLIATLATDGYRVLERDDNLMGWILPEQSGLYKGSLHRILPLPPAIAMIDALGEAGSHDASTDTDAAGLYRQLKEDYAALEAQQVRMDSADIVVSYRLLECGIIFDIEKKKQGTIDATGKENPNSPKLWTYNIKRDALARMFVRVTDAKTGEIRNADVLQNELTDTVTFRQDKDETDAAYFARINEYLDLLSKYHYTYYDQQLPNQKGTGSQVVAVTDTSKPTGLLLGSMQTSAASRGKTFPGTVLYAEVMGGLIMTEGTGEPASDPMFMVDASFSTLLFKPLGLLAGFSYNSALDDAIVSLGITYDIGTMMRMGLRGGITVGSVPGGMVSAPFVFNFTTWLLSVDVGVTFSDTSTGFFAGIGAGFGF